jgi:hypothetical protein
MADRCAVLRLVEIEASVFIGDKGIVVVVPDGVTSSFDESVLTGNAASVADGIGNAELGIVRGFLSLLSTKETVMLYI